MSDFLSSMVKSYGNKYASLVSDGLDGSDVSGFVDTGCFILNGLLSASIYNGMPNNKITALAGETSTGKTYIALGIASKFLRDNPDAVVLYFDSEQAVTSDMFKNRGIDPKRIAVFPVSTVEEFRHQAITIVDKYLSLPKQEQKPTFIILDSLGMLSTSKEMTDTAEGKDTKDMTRAQIIKATFRVLTVKLGVAKIPLLMTNHTYQSMGMFPTAELAGGQGLKYAASTILFLSKRKDKNSDGEVIGNIIHCKLYKGRFTKENSMVDLRLNYETGLDPYYGLVDIAVTAGIFKKISTRIELPDGSKTFEKTIYDNPEKYFTKDILEQINKAVYTEFSYGGNLESKDDDAE